MSVPSAFSISPSTKTLNPRAPEYHPTIPFTGITPFSHPPPPPAAHYLLPPPTSPPLYFFPPQICTYIIAQQPPFTYHRIHPKNPNATKPTGPIGAVCPGQRKLGFRAGRPERRGEREHCLNLKLFQRRANHSVRNKADLRRCEKFCCSHEIQKEEEEEEEEEKRPKHKVIPVEKEGERTTVMMKNIPYGCSRKDLINLLDAFCMAENAMAARREYEYSTAASPNGSSEQHIVSAYDFLYLPIDFQTKRSRFVNFTNAQTVSRFFDSFHLTKWESVRWHKWPRKIEIVYARIQGKEDLAKHLSECVFDCKSEESLPVCFNPARDGSTAGIGKPFQVTVVGHQRNSNSRHLEAPKQIHQVAKLCIQ